MSTKSVADEADAAVESLLTLSTAAKASVKKLKKDKEAALKKKEQVAHAALIAARRLQDGVDDIEEQLGQLDLDNAPELTTPPAPPAAVVDLPAEPVTPAAPEPTPPAEPAPAATLPMPVHTPEPQEAFGLPPAQPVPVRYNPLNPHNWGLLQWIFAILGLFVMFAIASWNWDWWYQNRVFAVGTLFGVFMSFIFWVGLLMIGFFGGGLIGYAIDRWRLRRNGVDIEAVIQQRRERRRIVRERRLAQYRAEQYRLAHPVPPVEPPVA